MKISDKHFQNEDESINITISDDNQSAYLTISKTEQPINEEDIVTLIEESGISNGICKIKDNAEIAFDTPFLIASGTSSILPNVEFDKLFDESKSSILLKEYEIKNLKHLDFIPKDNPVAHFFVTKSGSLGKDIFGKIDENVKIDENIVDEYLGENVYFDKDRSQIMAKVGGYPYITNEKRVNVKSDFEINTDIDINFENFYLKGNLNVVGDIKDKIVIKIDGNLNVQGDIDDALIDVSGDINVKGNIRNCQSAGISASGNIKFISAENSKIVSGQKILFYENCHYCRLIANSEIIGDEAESLFVGGIAQSGGNIEIAAIGSSSNVSTEVEITVSPYIKEKMMRLSKRLHKLREDLSSNETTIKKLSEKLEDLEVIFEEDINQALYEENAYVKHILAFNRIFPGTYLRILKKSANIAEILEKVSFSIVDGNLNRDFF